MPVDFFNQELKRGDICVCKPYNYDYGMQIGVVTKVHKNGSIRGVFYRFARLDEHADVVPEAFFMQKSYTRANIIVVEAECLDDHDPRHYAASQLSNKILRVKAKC